MKGKLYQNFLQTSGASMESVVGQEAGQRRLRELYDQSKTALEALGLVQ